MKSDRAPNFHFSYSQIESIFQIAQYSLTYNPNQASL